MKFQELANSKTLKYGILLFPLFLVIWHWVSFPSPPGPLIYKVPQLIRLSFFETHYLYWYLHAISFVPVFFLSFDNRVRYYRKWKFLWPGMLIMAAFFIAWDVFATKWGVWGFNERYTTTRLLHLPLEEWCFFITIPFCTVFIYENILYARDRFLSIERPLTIFLIILFWVGGLASWGRTYTVTTFLLTGGFLLYHYIYSTGNYRSRFYLAYLFSWIPFLIINGILTGACTQEPVVLYNPEAFLGIRIVSIPLEDSVYSFLLLLGNITLYEYFQRISSRPKPG